MDMRTAINLVEAARKTGPLSYDDAVALIADDDELFNAVRLYVQNFESGLGENGPAMERFVAILSRMKKERRQHALWRGECRGQYWHEKFGRGFHSWSASLRTAKYFHGECSSRDAAVLLHILTPVRAVSLNDIITIRMRVRPDENLYAGDQAEWFVYDPDAVRAAKPMDPGRADTVNNNASITFYR